MGGQRSEQQVGGENAEGRGLSATSGPPGWLAVLLIASLAGFLLWRCSGPKGVPHPHRASFCDLGHDTGRWLVPILTVDEAALCARIQSVMSMPELEDPRCVVERKCDSKWEVNCKRAHGHGPTYFVDEISRSILVTHELSRSPTPDPTGFMQTCMHAVGTPPNLVWGDSVRALFSASGAEAFGARSPYPPKGPQAPIIAAPSALPRCLLGSRAGGVGQRGQMVEVPIATQAAQALCARVRAVRAHQELSAAHCWVDRVCGSIWGINCGANGPYYYDEGSGVITRCRDRDGEPCQALEHTCQEHEERDAWGRSVEASFARLNWSDTE